MQRAKRLCKELHYGMNWLERNGMSKPNVSSMPLVPSQILLERWMTQKSKRYAAQALGFILYFLDITGIFSWKLLPFHDSHIISSLQGHSTHPFLSALTRWVSWTLTPLMDESFSSCLGKDRQLQELLIDFVMLLMIQDQLKMKLNLFLVKLKTTWILMLRVNTLIFCSTLFETISLLDSELNVFPEMLEESIVINYYCCSQSGEVMYYQHGAAFGLWYQTLTKRILSHLLETILCMWVTQILSQLLGASGLHTVLWLNTHLMQQSRVGFNILLYFNLNYMFYVCLYSYDFLLYC